MRKCLFAILCPWHTEQRLPHIHTYNIYVCFTDERDCCGWVCGSEITNNKRTQWHIFIVRTELTFAHTQFSVISYCLLFIRQLSSSFVSELNWAELIRISALLPPPHQQRPHVRTRNPSLVIATYALCSHKYTPDKSIRTHLLCWTRRYYSPPTIYRVKPHGTRVRRVVPPRVALFTVQEVQQNNEMPFIINYLPTTEF